MRSHRLRRPAAALLLAVAPAVACRERAPDAAPGAGGAGAVGADSAVALARHALRSLPEGAQYLPDSVRVEPTDSSWRVFVRHVEWERRRPPETLLEVSRTTGRVTQVPLK